MTITPQQYFYSAKEKLEIIDERNYDVKDLDEIIRVLENAEKDAKKGEIIDKSRLYLVLANTLKARKQLFDNRLKGQFVANRAKPFFVLDTKPIKETLRTAKKWLRSCQATFKTESIRADLEFVTGMYYTQKMLTQRSREAEESLWTAVHAYRRCMGLAPDYKSDFRVFGRIQGKREVRLKLIECLAMGKEVIDAFFLVSDYSFSPSTPKLDYPWMHMKGLVLAFMGRYEEAEKMLEKFKIVSPLDYPQVDEALWVLEGVYDRLREETEEDRYGMEAKIVASLLKKLKGPFSKEKYTTAAHLFPGWLPGDKQLFTGVLEYVEGDLVKATQTLEPLQKRGLVSRVNRLFAKVLFFETAIYAEKKVPDELLLEVLETALDNNLSPLVKERIGFLFARYILADLKDFGTGLLKSEGQTFTRTIMEKPWAIQVQMEKGGENTPVSQNQPDAQNLALPGKATLRAFVYGNRAEDWITSANVSLVALPQISLIGKSRIVGKEEEGRGWAFRGPEIDALLVEDKVLAVFEFADSDSEKSYQGVVLDLKPKKKRRKLL